MARLEYFVVAKAVSIDQSTNQTSIFEIIEELGASKFPSIIPRCVAISLWRKEPGDEEKDFQVNLHITTPGANVIDFSSNFQFTAPRHRVVQRIDGLPIEKEGELHFEAILNSKHVAEHVVDVRLSEPADAIELSVETDEDAGSEHSSD